MTQSLLERGLHLLKAATPELGFDQIARLSIGERDRRLLQLREWLFGTKLVNTAHCPECSEVLEWENTVSDICVQSVSQDVFQETQDAETFSLPVDEYLLHFRLPNSSDISKRRDDLNPVQLIQDCIVSADRSSETVAISTLPAQALKAVAERIEALDPQAEIRMTLACPECAHVWDILFDILSFLWIEINLWSENILRTIHRLASAYGWSEEDILYLSPMRRQLYLGFINS